jgi:hypothetical protein
VNKLENLQKRINMVKKLFRDKEVGDWRLTPGAEVITRVKAAVILLVSQWSQC